MSGEPGGSGGRAWPCAGGEGGGDGACPVVVGSARVGGGTSPGATGVSVAPAAGKSRGGEGVCWASAGPVRIRVPRVPARKRPARVRVMTSSYERLCRKNAGAFVAFSLRLL